MNESALGPELRCTESVAENVKKEKQQQKKKTKGKKKERHLGLIKKRRKEG